MVALQGGELSVLYAALAAVSPGEEVIEADFGQDHTDGEMRKVPLIASFPPRLSRAGLAGVLRQVAEAAAAHRPDFTGEIDAAVSALYEIPEVWEDLLAGGPSRQKRLEELRVFLDRREVSFEIAGFLIHHTLKPLLRCYARKAAQAQPVHFETWEKGCCPVCGAYPNLAVIKGEKGRFLYCGLCETSWRFTRLGCPFCEVTSVGEQEILALEGTPYRIYLCANCRGYLKTVLQQSGETFDPLAVEGKTLHLDLLALREGYVNRTMQASGAGGGE
ncbi:MAG: formate dehydrogenase accessory protein FdhE [Bacillota bacterium]|nr:formate dehydrogenase accessory protein FdhE [Thermoanaerobacteraceae bacterium]